MTKLEEIREKLHADVHSINRLPKAPSVLNMADYIALIEKSKMHSHDEKLCIAAEMLDLFEDRALRNDAIKMGLKSYMGGITRPEETRGAQLFFDALLADQGKRREAGTDDCCYKNHALVMQSMRHIMRERGNRELSTVFNAYVDRFEPFAGPVKYAVLPSAAGAKLSF